MSTKSAANTPTKPRLHIIVLPQTMCDACLARAREKYDAILRSLGTR